MNATAIEDCEAAVSDADMDHEGHDHEDEDHEGDAMTAADPDSSGPVKEAAPLAIASVVAAIGMLN